LQNILSPCAGDGFVKPWTLKSLFRDAGIAHLPYRVGHPHTLELAVELPGLLDSAACNGAATNQAMASTISDAYLTRYIVTTSGAKNTLSRLIFQLAW
jgi:hypothetical protein